MKSYYLVLVSVLYTVLGKSNLKKSDISSGMKVTSPQKDLGKVADSDLDKMSDEELEGMMKKYGLDTDDLTSIAKLPTTDLKEKKIINTQLSLSEIVTRNRDALKKFDMSQTDAMNFVNLLTQYNVFNKLSVAAMNILNEVHNKYSYQQLVTSTHQNEQMINSLNSQVFIDSQNMTGRKGMLTLIDKNTSQVQTVWAVINNKVIAFYKTSNYLEIIKVYRLALAKIKDFLYSPCFFIYYDHQTNVNFQNSQALVCALNFREKENWIQTIKYNKQQYNPTK